jgi:hypothetical protein
MYLVFCEGSVRTAFLSDRLNLSNTHLIGLRPTQFRALRIQTTSFDDEAVQCFHTLNNTRTLQPYLLNDMDWYAQYQKMANLERVNLQRGKMARILKFLIIEKLEQLRQANAD